MFWPLVVVGRQAREGPRPPGRGMGGGRGGAGLGGVDGGGGLVGMDLSRIYYGTDTRAFALFAGAWLGTWWDPASRAGRHPGRAAHPAAVAGPWPAWSPWCPWWRSSSWPGPTPRPSSTRAGSRPWRSSRWCWWRAWPPAAGPGRAARPPRARVDRPPVLRHLPLVVADPGLPLGVLGTRGLRPRCDGRRPRHRPGGAVVLAGRGADPHRHATGRPSARRSREVRIDRMPRWRSRPWRWSWWSASSWAPRRARRRSRTTRRSATRRRSANAIEPTDGGAEGGAAQGGGGHHHADSRCRRRPPGPFTESATCWWTRRLRRTPPAARTVPSRCWSPGSRWAGRSPSS